MRDLHPPPNPRDNLTDRMIKINLKDWERWDRAARLAYPEFPKPRMPWIRVVLNREAARLLKDAEETGSGSV